MRNYKIRKQFFVKLENLIPTVALFIVLHTIVLPYLCSNMAFSYYFQEDSTNHTDDRQILMFNNSNSDHIKDQSSMVIVIQTAPRAREENYFLQTLVSVLEQVSIARESHQVYVCSGEHKFISVLVTTCSCPSRRCRWPCGVSTTAWSPPPPACAPALPGGQVSRRGCGEGRWCNSRGKKEEGGEKAE